MNRNLRIFLSTDNVDVEKEMTIVFGERIVKYPQFLPSDLNGRGIHHWAFKHNVDNKKQMFEEALADMWILSMCKYLFWQGNSSFSLMSCVLKKDKENIFDWLKI